MSKKKQPQQQQQQQQQPHNEEEEEEDDHDFFADIQKDLNHMNVSSPTMAGATKKKKPTMHQPSPSPSFSSDILLPNSQLPFVGRQSELQTLHQAVQRISLDWMENPSEVLLVNGSQGVGKTTFVHQAAQQGPFWKVLVVRGTCEENTAATQPFAALTEVLNDLATQLLPQKAVWKPRLEEALGGEGPLVATIVPSLCPLLQCSPMEKRLLLQFDANTPKRSTRLGIAIRDLLHAISEYQPLVMIVDNLHWADPDSLRIWQDLLTHKSFLNVLFVGIHDIDVLSSPSSGWQAPFLAFYKAIEEEHTHLRQLLISPLTKAELQSALSQLFPYRDEDVPDLVDLVSALTKGNPLWVCQLLKFWNESHHITYQSDPIKSSNWVWNRKRLKKEIKRCIEEGLTTYQDVEGIIRARLNALPRKIQFAILIFARMRLTQFRIPLQKPEDGDQLYKVFVAAVFHKAAKEKQDPIGSSDELVKMALKACTLGILKRNPHTQDTMSFTNDLMRKCATTIVSEYYEKLKKEQDQEQQSLKIGLYIGTELSRLSIVATRSSKKATTVSETAAVTADAAERTASVDAEHQRERYKLLAADVLYQCKQVLDVSDKVALAKINVEAAEIAMAKSAFQSAIVYLERAVEVSDVTSRWLPTQYDVTLRTIIIISMISSYRLDRQLLPMESFKSA
jgi:AAA ATPase domain